jgi:hypothetical protein
LLTATETDTPSIQETKYSLAFEQISVRRDFLRKLFIKNQSLTHPSNTSLPFKHIQKEATALSKACHFLPCGWRVKMNLPVLFD